MRFQLRLRQQYRYPELLFRNLGIDNHNISIIDVHNARLRGDLVGEEALGPSQVSKQKGPKQF